MAETQRVKRIRDALNGVLLLDKPVGLSSNDALIQTKRLLNAKKAGHTGTLDPFATGLLPLCFGEATKFSHDLLFADKTYETVVHLGITTETGDTEGAVLENLSVGVTLEQIDAVLAQFRGPIEQVPPMYSALKRDGKPLYEYARAGITLEREARNVVIHELTLLSYEAPFLRLRVACSKGTYIRVLGEDIGRALGCGAHLNALRRTQVASLKLADAISLDAIQQMSPEQRINLLKPVDALLSDFEAIQLTDELAVRFLHGQRLALQKEGINLPELIPANLGRVRVYRFSDGKLLGSGLLQEYQVLAPERLISTSG
ncbi:tRNA pseudouridine(55) synthase TruB [Solimicrobium silvestre]|uniref:tRNA pseudouridine synthase B n=1 Tax=Solimicrobium silvestre TaxID=2099400 RepID=A0A2S9GYT0_9BURK|nr:tRNA pseudouridine(55) synthase TruB [Solimicrobium silvestre]PRC92879.1 TruB: tRNA pseudouridine(55) synthase [Solimicrobium silvestre]